MKLVSLDSLDKNDILSNYDAEDVATEAELENELENLFNEANIATGGTATHVSGRQIFQKIRKFICDHLLTLEAYNNFTDLLDKLSEAIASVIPGGKIIQGLVSKILKYLIDKGYHLICPQPE